MCGPSTSRNVIYRLDGTVLAGDRDRLPEPGDPRYTELDLGPSEAALDEERRRAVANRMQAMRNTGYLETARTSRSGLSMEEFKRELEQLATGKQD